MMDKPCKLWEGKLNGSGYGTVWDGRRVIGVHRLAWEQANGMEVPEGFHVCHPRIRKEVRGFDPYGARCPNWKTWGHVS